MRGLWCRRRGCGQTRSVPPQRLGDDRFFFSSPLLQIRPHFLCVVVVVVVAAEDQTTSFPATKCWMELEPEGSLFLSYLVVTENRKRRKRKRGRLYSGLSLCRATIIFYKAFSALCIKGGHDAHISWCNKRPVVILTRQR